LPRVCADTMKRHWPASPSPTKAATPSVVEATLSTTVDGYFMEFGSVRAGGFEPLHVLQDSGDKAKKVVLGLIITKVGALESKDELKRRTDEAGKGRRSNACACRRSAASTVPITAMPRRSTNRAQARTLDRRCTRDLGMTRMGAMLRTIPSDRWRSVKAQLLSRGWRL
jgi:hypothetical protein